MKDFSYITNQHPQYIENLYLDFKNDPLSVDPELKKFFEGFDFAMVNVTDTVQVNGKVDDKQTTVSVPSGQNGLPISEPTATDWMFDLRAYRLILGYRNKGHLLARTNPIRERRDRGANIELEFFGFSDADLDKTFQSGKLIGLGPTTLRNIHAHLQKCYAHHVGWEFKYISDQAKIDWLTNEIERKFHEPLPLDDKRRILEKLNEGVMFEKFLHTKYIGQKRFSLEGGETTIAALDRIITVAADHGVEEVVIGMAHRGRLNILANIMGKTYEQIFSEFEGSAIPDTTMGSGDVKYHLGFGSQPTTANGKTIT
jgi:2-oxoglutarate dehydrogenase E1 component